MKQIKHNGKNLLAFSYLTQEYMDLHPEPGVMTIESEEKMNEFCRHMSSSPWSGRYFDQKELTPQELFEIRNSAYWRGYEDKLDHLAEDCTQEWVDEYNKLLATL